MLCKALGCRGRRGLFLTHNYDGSGRELPWCVVIAMRSALSAPSLLPSPDSRTRPRTYRDVCARRARLLRNSTKLLRQPPLN